MSRPILTPITWRDLRREPTAATCAICRRPTGGDDADDDAGCERCGVALHFTCWLERLASPTERLTYHAGVAERKAAGASQLDATMLHNLTALAEALAVPLAEVVGLIHPAGPAEQAVGRLILTCNGCRS